MFVCAFASAQACIVSVRLHLFAFARVRLHPLCCATVCVPLTKALLSSFWRNIVDLYYADGLVQNPNRATSGKVLEGVLARVLAEEGSPLLPAPPFLHSCQHFSGCCPILYQVLGRRCNAERGNANPTKCGVSDEDPTRNANCMRMTFAKKTLTRVSKRVPGDHGKRGLERAPPQK